MKPNPNPVLHNLQHRLRRLFRATNAQLAAELSTNFIRFRISTPEFKRGRGEHAQRRPHIRLRNLARPELGQLAAQYAAKGCSWQPWRQHTSRVPRLGKWLEADCLGLARAGHIPGLRHGQSARPQRSVLEGWLLALAMLVLSQHRIVPVRNAAKARVTAKRRSRRVCSSRRAVQRAVERLSNKHSFMSMCFKV